MYRPGSADYKEKPPRLWRPRFLKRKAHFLHICKTGGTAVRSVLKECRETPNYRIKLHNHDVSLEQIRRGEKGFFFLRDPVSRFASAFYSRLRQGRPRYVYEWNDLERKLFSVFQTPRAMAAALANEVSPHHQLTKQALREIEHFQPYRKWCGEIAYLRSREKDVLYVGFQESLDQDFEQLEQILRLPGEVDLPDDHVVAHRMPPQLDTVIEEPGLSALRQWYAADYEMIAFCRELMAERGLRN